ncbi:MAG: hypothetical protein JSV63_02070 [Candidatus Aenigmatarchaeota archaeon]|nr:MAG: hypothetical protein JSV63_02070 [Candidatus Aenigmarchaeota archaeon]
MAETHDVIPPYEVIPLIPQKEIYRGGFTNLLCGLMGALTNFDFTYQPREEDQTADISFQGYEIGNLQEGQEPDTYLLRVLSRFPYIEEIKAVLNEAGFETQSEPYFET